jgi:alkanesulfonate monooxygenase SsuD/methylene tetrahydromethanopterin reductase-like flavin-dependent oxidoreductase (luciferase family)
MLTVNTIAGDTDGEARFLASSMQESFANLRAGRPGRLPPPVADYLDGIDADRRLMLSDYLALAVIGGPKAVQRKLRVFADRHGADELILLSQIFDHAKRVRSIEIAAGVMAARPQK